jgi:hypothetical protein
MIVKMRANFLSMCDSGRAPVMSDGSCLVGAPLHPTD